MFTLCVVSVKKTDGVHREESSRPKKSVAFSSTAGLRGHLSDDDNGRFNGDVRTNQTRLSTSCTGARGQSIAVLERCESRTEEEETAREPLLVTPVAPGPIQSFTRRRSRSTIYEEKGDYCGDAVSVDDVRTECSARGRCLEEAQQRAHGGHGTAHQKSRIGSAASTTATIDETPAMGQVEKPTTFQSRRRCQSCCDGHLSSAASRKLVLRLDALYALSGHQQYFARRAGGGSGGGGGDYDDWCGRNDEARRPADMGALYLVLQVGQISHQTAAQHPQLARPTRGRRQGDVDTTGDARWTFGETVVLHLASATTGGPAAPAVRILAYRRRSDGRSPTDRWPPTKFVGGSSLDADRPPVVGEEEGAGFADEDILVGSASLSFKNNAARCSGVSEECTFQHPLEIPMLSMLEGVAIGWLVLSVCGGGRWSVV